MWHLHHVDIPVLESIGEILGAFRLFSPSSQDERGWFRDSLWLPALPVELRQDFTPQQVSISHSTVHVVRGIHYSVTEEHGSYSQTVTCAQGEVEDVIVDLRQGSPTFGRASKHFLSPDSGLTLLIPPGVGHGFRVASVEATLVYTMSRAYSDACTRAIRPDSLPMDLLHLSPGTVQSYRDRTAPSLDEAIVEGLLPQWEVAPR